MAFLKCKRLRTVFRCWKIHTKNTYNYKRLSLHKTFALVRGTTMYSKHHKLTCNISNVLFFFWTKILVRGMDELSLHGGDQLGHLQSLVQTSFATTHRFTITKKTFSRHSTNIQSRGAVSLVTDDWLSARTGSHFLVSTGSPNISHTRGFVSHNWLHFLHIRPDRFLRLWRHRFRDVIDVELIFIHAVVREFFGVLCPWVPEHLATKPTHARYLFPAVHVALNERKTRNILSVKS